LIFQHFNLPTLKRVTFKRYGASKDGTDPAAPWGYEGGLIAVNQDELERLLPPDRYHTGSMTLELSDPSTPAYVSQHFVRWPARLETLSITWLAHSIAVKHYTADVLERILSVHCQSLKYIKLGIMPYQVTPDFSNFPSLIELSMSAYNFLSDTPPDAVKKLAAPSLRRLAIDFCLEGQHAEQSSDFGARRVSWFKDFASLKKTQYPASKLDTISIKFNPDDFPNPNSFGEWRIWPWEYVEQSRQAVSQYGLVIEYANEPEWTKERWDEIVEEGWGDTTDENDQD
jgi:hypothetical protein